MVSETNKDLIASLQSARDRMMGAIPAKFGEAFDGDFDVMLEAINLLKRQDLAALRQQAFSQFANPEALADWLDALHECHADGSVGNRKWEAAQVAARAIRSMNEPSGNSGQLRQQAGRVDAVTIREVISDLREWGNAGDEQLLVRANWLEAALAQNTQGDGEPVAEIGAYWDLRYFGNEPISKIVERCGAKIGDKLYLHAGRARVPEGWVLIRKASLNYWLRELNGARQGDNAQQRAELVHSGLAAYIAAAPSQCAEVK